MKISRHARPRSGLSPRVRPLPARARRRVAPRHPLAQGGRRAPTWPTATLGALGLLARRHGGVRVSRFHESSAPASQPARLVGLWRFPRRQALDALLADPTTSQIRRLRQTGFDADDTADPAARRRPLAPSRALDTLLSSHPWRRSRRAGEVRGPGCDERRGRRREAVRRARHRARARRRAARRRLLARRRLRRHLGDRAPRRARRAARDQARVARLAADAPADAPGALAARRRTSRRARSSRS